MVMSVEHQLLYRELRIPRRRTLKGFTLLTTAVSDNHNKTHSFKSNRLLSIKVVMPTSVATLPLSLLSNRVQEVFHTPDHVYMVMDLYTGGDMYARYKFRSEDDTAKIVNKLINALRYCHDRNVAVRFGKGPRSTLDLDWSFKKAAVLQHWVLNAVEK